MRRVIGVAFQGWTKVETWVILATTALLAGIVILALQSSIGLYTESAELIAQAQQLAADLKPTQQISNQIAVLLARAASADSQGSDVATACIAAISGLAVTIGLAVAHGKKIHRLFLEEREAGTSPSAVMEPTPGPVEPKQPSPQPSAPASV